MSLMGVVMLAGIAMSNSILIVEFAHHLKSEGQGVGEAVVESCRVRLRPILMTSLATIIGLLPMALKLGEGSESYAPLARALIGGLSVSVAVDGIPGAGRILPGICEAAQSTGSMRTKGEFLPHAIILYRLTLSQLLTSGRRLCFR